MEEVSWESDNNWGGAQTEWLSEWETSRAAFFLTSALLEVTTGSFATDETTRLTKTALTVALNNHSLLHIRTRENQPS